MRRDVKYLTLSDIHLGHKRNSTLSIIKSLDMFFTDYSNKSQFTDLDIIFIAGDLFDSLLDFSSYDIHEATVWLGRLMHFCARFHIKLRILEGTPSHDWKQSRIAETIEGLLDIDIDFKYVETLYIEHIADLDIRVLYVPDEWTGNASLTFNQVKELMSASNIDSVDIAVMHGMFGYQLKDLPIAAQKHSEADYLSIVRHYITIGHIHNFSVYDRIISQGSFDRLAHGEEEPKGAVLCTISDTGNNSFVFIENRNAKIFKTIEIRTSDLEKAFQIVDKAVRKLPNDSYIRIKATKNHPIYVAFEDFKVRYPFFTFSKISLEDEEEKYLLINESIETSTEYVPISITADNVVDLLRTEISSKYQLTERQFSILDNLLLGTVE